MLLLSLALVAAQAGRVPVEDRIDVVEVDRRVLAVNANGTVAEVELDVDERVLATASEGLVAVATTTSRLLGFPAGNPGVRELRYRVAERRAPPARIYLAERVALVPLGHRLAALGPASASWNELELAPDETLENVYIDTNLIGVITPLRAIAFAPQSSGFISVALTPEERIEQSSSKPSTLTLTTSRRILIFQSGSRRWIERIRRVQ